MTVSAAATRVRFSSKIMIPSGRTSSTHLLVLCRRVVQQCLEHLVVKRPTAATGFLGHQLPDALCRVFSRPALLRRGPDLRARHHLSQLECRTRLPVLHLKDACVRVDKREKMLSLAALAELDEPLLRVPCSWARW